MLLNCTWLKSDGLHGECPVWLGDTAAALLRKGEGPGGSQDTAVPHCPPLQVSLQAQPHPGACCKNVPNNKSQKGCGCERRTSHHGS